MKVIINADEFGVSRSINSAIIEAMKNGILTSATIVAGGSDFYFAAEQSKSHFPYRVGVHLYLTDFQPSAGKSLMKGVPTQENLPGVMNFLADYTRGRIQYDAIYEELESQIKRVLENVGAISHLDGHNNLHVLPMVNKAILCLMRKYNISKIRLPRESFAQFDLRQPVQYLIKLGIRFFSEIAIGRLKENNISYTDHFYGIAHEGQIDEKQLKKFLKLSLTGHSSEIMVHPAIISNHLESNELRDIFGGSSGFISKIMSSYRWNDEYSALMSNQLKEFASSQGISLVSYGDL